LQFPVQAVTLYRIFTSSFACVRFDKVRVFKDFPDIEDARRNDFYAGQDSKKNDRKRFSGHCSLSKRVFDRLADGGTVPPPQPPLYRFHLKPAASGREICKETIFLPGNGISLHKNRCGRAVHAAATDFIFRSIEVF